MIKLTFAACLIPLVPLTSFASMITVSVPGISDIYLAGQPNGSVLGGESAPANSAILASTGLSLIPGKFLTFSVTGTTGVASTDPTQIPNINADGTSSFNSDANTIGPANGLSAFFGPRFALIGVFIDNSVPSGTSTLPVLPNITTFTDIAPALDQVFFIGDGLAGSKTQLFQIPTGATRLFLANSHGAGQSFGIIGSFNVTVSDGLPATVPEPNTLLFLFPILLFMLMRGYLRKRPRASDAPVRF